MIAAAARSRTGGSGFGGGGMRAGSVSSMPWSLHRRLRAGRHTFSVWFRLQASRLACPGSLLGPRLSELGADEVVGSVQKRSELRVEAGPIERTPSASRGLPERCQHRQCRESDALTLSPLCRSDPRWRPGGLFSSYSERWCKNASLPSCQASHSQTFGAVAVGK